MKFYFLFFISFFLTVTSYSQKSQQEMERILQNTGNEWKLDSTLQKLGRENRCNRGEYILFSTSPNTLVRRQCNDNGNWDTTRSAWSLTSSPGNKWELKLGDTTCRVYLKETNEKYILTLTYKKAVGNIRLIKTDKVYSAKKGHYE